MTETWLRALAERYGLEVLKRVTTGTERAGFATFELSGPTDRVVAAWVPVAEHGRQTGHSRSAGFVYMRASDADGQPYIGVESVWCDQGPDGKAGTWTTPVGLGVV